MLQSKMWHCPSSPLRFINPLHRTYGNKLTWAQRTKLSETIERMTSSGKIDARDFEHKVETFEAVVPSSIVLAAI